MRAAAASAAGQVGPAGPAQEESVAALQAVLKYDPEHGARSGALRSLCKFGPRAWAAVPALLDDLQTRSDAGAYAGQGSDAFALLARLSPPPVELLADLAGDERLEPIFRHSVMGELGALGPRARLALPALRRLMREPDGNVDFRVMGLPLSACESLLDIDPAGAAAQVVPFLVEDVKRRPNTRGALYLLARCGAAARPAVPALLASLDPKDYLSRFVVRGLVPQLAPDDRASLAAIRRIFDDLEGDSLGLADALLRVGERQEALALVARGLGNGYAPYRVAAARWLGQRGRDARQVEAALWQALGRAEGGERARLALTLWHAHGARGDAAQARALEALGDLLALCEGESPSVGRIDADRFWSQRGCYPGRQEDAAVGAAVAAVHCRLHAGGAAAAALAEALRDRSPYLRLVAAVALARVDPRHPDTVAALRRLLERQPHFFRYAADTLAALGPAAAPLTDLLLPLLSHPDGHVYRAAARVLRRIDPAAATHGWGAAGVPGAVPADLGPLWDDLAGADALRADLAVWRLAGAGPRAVALVRGRLRPPAAPSAERIARLIAELDGDDFAARQRASVELSEALEAAAPALRAALAAGPPLETRRRIDELLEGLDPTRSPEQRRRLRAVRLLAEIGGADARALLKRLAEGDARFALTREAAAELAHLDRP